MPLAHRARITYSASVRINEREIEFLAESVVRALLKQGFVRPKVAEKALVERIARLVLDNMRTESAIEEEAERLADKHARQMGGMDHRKIVQGIKDRLAKERGFVL